MTIAYSQPCHILSSRIFRTGGSFKALWKVDQTYSEPCHRVLFSHIQNLVQHSICRNLVYLESWKIHNFFIIVSRLIFRTVTFTKIYEYSALWHLKPNTYLEPSGGFKMEFFAKIVKNYNYFSKSLHLISLTGVWKGLSLIKYSLTCRVTSRYEMYDTYSEPSLLS